MSTAQHTKSSQQQQQLKMPKTMMKRFVKKTCDSSMIIVWSHLQWLAIAQSRVILCWVVGCVRVSQEFLNCPQIP